MVVNMSEYGICPNCGSKLVKKNGKNGEFIGCSAFPKCKFSMNYKQNYDSTSFIPKDNNSNEKHSFQNKKSKN